MKQKILFAKIAGQGKQQTCAKLLSFLKHASSDQVEAFLSRLRNTTELPLLYFCEYLDCWSTSEFASILAPKAHCFEWLLKSGYVFLEYFYPLIPDEILDALVPLRKRPNPADETVWLFQILEQCLHSWEPLVKGDSAVLLVRSSTGPSTLDDEIVNSSSCDLF
jgi:hypothetical protein